MKRAIIIHCWEGTPEYCWYPKTKRELEEKEFEVEVPEMPETVSPKLSAWLPALQRVAQYPSENLYLIGHSLGCITIMRYLEELPSYKKIGGAVFVAGFTDDLGYDELKNFFEKPIDFEKVRSAGNKFVVITSDNDPFVDLKYAGEFKEKLEAEVIIKKGEGHFSGTINDKASCTSLPEVSNAIFRMSSK